MDKKINYDVQYGWAIMILYHASQNFYDICIVIDTFAHNLPATQ